MVQIEYRSALPGLAGCTLFLPSKLSKQGLVAEETLPLKRERAGRGTVHVPPMPSQQSPVTFLLQLQRQPQQQTPLRCVLSWICLGCTVPEYGEENPVALLAVTVPQ